MRLNAQIRQDIVDAAMRDVPDPRPEIFERVKPKILEFYLDRLPEEVRPFWKTHPEIFESRWVNLGRYWERMFQLKVPTHDHSDPHKNEDWYVEAQKEFCAAKKVRDAAKKELEQAVKSVNTAKRLKEVYPDLAKYLPTDISGQALAVPQSLPALRAAGWPKGEEQ